MTAAIFRILPIASLVSAIALALTFAPASYTMPPVCPPVC